MSFFFARASVYIYSPFCFNKIMKFKKERKAFDSWKLFCNFKYVIIFNRFKNMHMKGKFRNLKLNFVQRKEMTEFDIPVSVI